MTFGNYLSSAMRYWYVVLLCGALGCGTGLVFASSAENSYQFTSAFVIAPQSAGQELKEVVPAVRSLEQGVIPRTFALILGEGELKRSAASALTAPLDLDQYDVTAFGVANTNAVRISVSGPDPETVRQISLGLAQLGSAQFIRLYPSFTIEDLTDSEATASSTSPSKVLYGGVGLAAGLVLGFLFALLIDTLRALRDDGEDSSGGPSVGERPIRRTER